MQELLTSEERRDINRRLENILNDKHKTYEVLEEVCSWLYDEYILRNKDEGLNPNLAFELQDARDEIHTLKKYITRVGDDLIDLQNSKGESFDYNASFQKMRNYLREIE